MSQVPNVDQISVQLVFNQFSTEPIILERRGTREQMFKPIACNVFEFSGGRLRYKELRPADYSIRRLIFHSDDEHDAHDDQHDQSDDDQPDQSDNEPDARDDQHDQSDDEPDARDDQHDEHCDESQPSPVEMDIYLYNRRFVFLSDSHLEDVYFVFIDGATGLQFSIDSQVQAIVELMNNHVSTGHWLTIDQANHGHLEIYANGNHVSRVNRTPTPDGVRESNAPLCDYFPIPEKSVCSVVLCRHRISVIPNESHKNIGTSADESCATMNESKQSEPPKYSLRITTADDYQFEIDRDFEYIITPYTGALGPIFNQRVIIRDDSPKVLRFRVDEAGCTSSFCHTPEGVSLYQYYGPPNENTGVSRIILNQRAYHMYGPALENGDARGFVRMDNTFMSIPFEMETGFESESDDDDQHDDHQHNHDDQHNHDNQHGEEPGPEEINAFIQSIVNSLNNPETLHELQEQMPEIRPNYDFHQIYPVEERLTWTQLELIEQDDEHPESHDNEHPESHDESKHDHSESREGFD